MTRHVELLRIADNKRDLDVLLQMLVRADIGFVLNQSGAVTKVHLLVRGELGDPMPTPRPVFTFTKVGGAMRAFELEP